MICAKTADLKPYVEQWLKSESLDELPISVIRRVYDIRHDKTEWMTLRVVDQLFVRMDRLDWFQLIQFYHVNYNRRGDVPVPA